MQFEESTPHMTQPPTNTMLSRKTITAAGATGLALTLALTVAEMGSAAPDTKPAGLEARTALVEECSNRTIRGDYGFAIDGQVAGPLAVRHGLAMTHFDGRGNTSQADLVTIKRVPHGADRRPRTGTYQVNADCTGTATFAFTRGSPILDLGLVVLDGGREIQIVGGSASGSRGVKVR